ncbi:MAG: hypothetical protein N3E45_08545 [Oscillatoriaceae bacterium SKW80]|nr:hypothetical protein [Oscillatoriaceae bacterium SKYG93]MCX8120869.1 hypothetical protein [Oscillatoriaceae bacterium SKW80]MDW8454210.1 hypothetical protein [Oscillatoriaceae cyanobacterium SKYGB_i_bin93]HIK26465.1 hypothetical protein [Oscillatoriaceae cyanobacterium M7585_C2015_266]
MAIAKNKILYNITSTSLIYVQADTNQSSNSMDEVRIENNTVNGSIFAKASAGESGNIIQNNKGNNSSFVEASSHITVRGNTGFQEKPCLKLDNPIP